MFESINMINCEVIHSVVIGKKNVTGVFSVFRLSQQLCGSWDPQPALDLLCRGRLSGTPWITRRRRRPITSTGSISLCFGSRCRWATFHFHFIVIDFFCLRLMVARLRCAACRGGSPGLCRGERTGRGGSGAPGETPVHPAHAGVPQERRQGHKAWSCVPGNSRTRVSTGRDVISLLFITSVCARRRFCSWFRARPCRPLAPASSSRSSPRCSSGRTSRCLTRLFRRWCKRHVCLQPKRKKQNKTISVVWCCFDSLFCFKGVCQHSGSRFDPGVHQRDVHHETVWAGESPPQVQQPGASLCAPPLLILLPLPQFFLPSLLRFIAGLLGRGDLASHNVCLDVLVSLILAKAPPPTDGSMAFETYPLLFTGQTTGSGEADFSSRPILWNPWV